MAKEMEESLGMLVPYLRTRLKNEAISLEVRVAEQTERPKVLTRREAFARMLEENPEMRDILSDFEATMVD